MIRYLHALAATLLLTGCASVPYTDAVVADGGQLIEGDMVALIGEKGVTVIGESGDWWAFYDADGRKVTYVKPLDETAELSWSKNELGQFCEVQFRSREEICYGNEYQMVKTKDDLYSRVKNGKKGQYPFRIREGNSKSM